MIYPKIPLAQTVVQLCKKHNISHIVISPGSRNAPLTIGFTSDSYFKTYSIVDERCAAFFGLGIAQQIHSPVALVCTSGSALLNYYPAVAEAFYSEIPLVVISADRPKHLIDIGDGQTIKQTNVYGDHALFSTSLKTDIDAQKVENTKEELPIFKNIENKLERFLGIQKGIQQHNEADINKALNIAFHNSGPVHINVPLDEPLYKTTGNLVVDPKREPWPDTDKIIDEEAMDNLASTWSLAQRKLILVGVLSPNSIDAKLFNKLIEDPSVLVLAETTSNLHHPRIFNSIDKLIDSLSDEQFEELQPETVMTFGGMVISKKIKRFLRNFAPARHWHIGTNRANDTFFKLKAHINVDINAFLSEFLPKIKIAKSEYYNTWHIVRQYRNTKHNKFLSQAKFSDLLVFETILNQIPNETVLQLGNSSVIRYTQLFDLNSSLKVFCNRGTSGIDGSTSTAVGCAVANSEPTLLITGDLSFFYDSNALWNSEIPKNFRIILINNGGGGIFRIISPNKDTENFTRFFETTHDLDARNLCEMFKIEYTSAQDSGELIEQLSNFFNTSESSRLLEIFTPRALNEEVLKSYFKFISYT